jgi:transcription elongation factor GreA
MTRESLEALRTKAERLASEAARTDGYVSAYMIGERDAPTLVPNLDGHRLIRQLEMVRAVLASASVETDAAVAVIGRVVTLEEADGSRTRYTLVAPGHGDPASGLLSADSPVGRAIYGSRAGQLVRVEAPTGAWTAVVADVADEPDCVTEWDPRLT